MKIKGKLVFDKHSGKLIGFTSLGDPDLDFSTFEEFEVATHASCMVVQRCANNSEIYVGILSRTDSGVLSIGPTVLASSWNIELNCNLHVVATSSDGMSANRKFYRLHKHSS